jgi:hypothetical protein
VDDEAISRKRDCHALRARNDNAKKFVALYIILCFHRACSVLDIGDSVWILAFQIVVEIVFVTLNLFQGLLTH